MKPNLLFIIAAILLISCRSSRDPIDNIGGVNSQFANYEAALNSSEVRYKESNSKPGLYARIFGGGVGKRDTPKKLKNVTIIHQTAGGDIGAVTTAKVKDKSETLTKDKSKSKSDEKLKGQNAIKGDGNTATAAKSDKSLMWVVIALVVVSGAILYFRRG